VLKRTIIEIITDERIRSIVIRTTAPSINGPRPFESVRHSNHILHASASACHILFSTSRAPSREFADHPECPLPASATSNPRCRRRAIMRRRHLSAGRIRNNAINAQYGIVTDQITTPKKLT
jgi:hypothetical protein